VSHVFSSQKSWPLTAIKSKFYRQIAKLSQPKKNLRIKILSQAGR